MSFRNKLAILAMAVPLLGLLAACGKSEPPKPAAAAAPAAAPKEMVKWKHGLIKPQVASAFVLMAKNKEYFKKYGIDMEYQEFISAPLMTQALTAGALDSVEANPVGAILVNTKGGNIKIIGSTMPGLDLAVYAKKELKTIADLQGKKIGTSAAKDLPDLLMRAIFQKQGLPTENATYAAVGGNGDRFNALRTGAIDADVNSLDVLPQVEGDPNLHMIAIGTDIVPDFPRLMLMVDGERIKSKPREAVVGVLAAMMEGLQYATDHPDEAKKLAAANIGISADDPRIVRYYDLAIKRNFASPRMEAQTQKIDWLQDFVVSMKMVPAKLPMEKLMDMSYRDEAFKIVYGGK